MTRPRLEIDLTVRRGSFRVEASFDVEPGRTTALIGPNGAGKSTLVSAIAGLAPLESGHVRHGDESLDDVSRGLHLRAAARGVGLLPQESLLFPHMTLRENVAFPLRARGVGRVESRRRAGEWLERMGVSHRADARGREVSGGEAKRAALARALIFEPRILLLDEPLTGLDIEARAGLRAVLWPAVESFEGIRIVITHEPLEALMHAERLAILENGRMVQTGTPGEVRGRPRSPFIASFLGMNVIRGALKRNGDGWVVSSPEGDLACVPGDPRDGAPVAAVIHPHDILVLKETPRREHGNIIEGVVTSMSLKEERSWISIAARPSLNVDMPAAAVRSLALAPGDRVWMIVRLPAVDVHAL